MSESDIFRSPGIVEKLKRRIERISTKPLKIMEFCGTHSHAISRYGIRQLLPPTIEMFSGPGCPVCVTSDRDIDYAVALTRVPGVMITTFGDLMRVPGSRGSLLDARAKGAQVEIVYSPLDALDLAAKNPTRKVVFLGIGFETTAPAIAASIVQAGEMGLDNYYVFCAHKLTPPAMRAILDADEVSLNGVLCPGHVSTVTGWAAWRFLPGDYRISAAVAGFQPVDILRGIAEIVRQWEADAPEVKNTYERGVTAEGNNAAQEMMGRVFESCRAQWRGLGMIDGSGLAIREEYARFDARLAFDVGPLETVAAAHGCRCGEVIRGVAKPYDCQLFKSTCTPAHPVGPCMVSSEGGCAAYYLYG
jgi:hydrogenase expression/formation protein HypD